MSENSDTSVAVVPLPDLGETGKEGQEARVDAQPECHTHTHTESASADMEAPAVVEAAAAASAPPQGANMLDNEASPDPTAPAEDAARPAEGTGETPVHACVTVQQPQPQPEAAKAKPESEASPTAPPPGRLQALSMYAERATAPLVRMGISRKRAGFGCLALIVLALAVGIGAGVGSKAGATSSTSVVDTRPTPAATYSVTPTPAADFGDPTPAASPSELASVTPSAEPSPSNAPSESPTPAETPSTTASPCPEDPLDRRAICHCVVNMNDPNWSSSFTNCEADGISISFARNRKCTRTGAYYAPSSRVDCGCDGGVLLTSGGVTRRMCVIPADKENEWMYLYDG